MIKKNHYDFIMLDINMPDTDFSSLLNWIHSSSPTTRVLIFTTHSENIFGVRCMQAGTSGFLNKTASNSEIEYAVRRILDNKKYISADLANYY